MGPFANNKGIDPKSPKSQKLKWIDEIPMQREPAEKQNDKGTILKYLRTNPSEDDLCLKEDPEPVIVHKQGTEIRSIIKVPFSKYKIEADPVESPRSGPEVDPVIADQEPLEADETPTAVPRDEEKKSSDAPL